MNLSECAADRIECSQKRNTEPMASSRHLAAEPILPIDCSQFLLGQALRMPLAAIPNRLVIEGLDQQVDQGPHLGGHIGT